MECPDCGGPTWDNREDKRNPKSPDFKCKSKQCGKGVWLKPKSNGAPPPQRGGRPQTNAPSSRRRDFVTPAENKALWRQAQEDYRYAWAIALNVIVGKGVAVTAEALDAVAHAATGLCIRMEKAREYAPPIVREPPPPPPPPKPKPAPVPESDAGEFEDFADYQPDDDRLGEDGLPF